MSSEGKVACNEQITQVRFDRHTIQFSLEGGGVVVAEGVLKVRTPDGEVIIDVKGDDRNLNVLSALLGREITCVNYNASSVALEIEGSCAVHIIPSGRGGEAGLIRIDDLWIVIA